jgi:hypothetical protein
MSLAFHLTETMSGLHHFVDASGGSDERPVSFRLTWGSGLAPSLGTLLRRRQMVHPCAGVVLVEGLTDGEAPCNGTLSIDYFGERSIVYSLGFAVGGRRFTLHAEKRGVDLSRPVSLVKTHTTAYMKICDAAGGVVSRGVLHFHGDSIGEFARSFRVSRAPAGERQQPRAT